jgi:UDP-glucose 4-epimerase
LNETVLITGGAGFIGSHLTELLLEKGKTVRVLDNFSTGSRDNISHLIDSENFEFTEGDISDSGLVDKLTAGCSKVYHLAAAVGVRLIAESPVHTIETNLHGTEIILEYCNKHGCRVFLASSSEVYGKTEKTPFREEDDLVMGATSYSRWAYACSKAIDEFLGFAFHREFGLGVVIGRFFNTIGPRQTGVYGMVVPRFVGWGLKGENIQVYGDGKQSRCFCYVGDVVTAVYELMESEKTSGQVYNIGTNEEITIDELADKVLELTGNKAGKEYLPYSQAYGREIEDMKRRVPSTEKISNAVGWSPQKNLEQSLKIIIDYFRKHKKAETDLES